MTQDLCRAEFEKWYSVGFRRGDCHYLRRLKVDGGDYSLLSTQKMWLAWSTAWNAKPATEHNPADNSQNIEWTGAA